MESRKILKPRYSSKDLACLLEVSYATFRNEMSANAQLKRRLRDMGWKPYRRYRKEHVLEIFKELGFPDGYEWYEKSVILNS